MLNSPVFCLTSDVDWASDAVIDSFLELTSRYGITPTMFATHRSQRLEEAEQSGAVDLGIHPNFLPGSSHGADIKSVIEHLCSLFPNATSFRSHSFVDSSGIASEMVRRGFTHDSNLCLYLQAHLMPLRHCSGLVRFPVFWEDDDHWNRTDSDWDIDRYLADFLTPGLKVINVHPFHAAANIPSEAAYQAVKHHMTTADIDQLAAIRFEGPGVGTFLDQLLSVLTARGERFMTLAELYRVLGPSEPLAFAGASSGREVVHSDDEHEHYWSASEQERQEFLRQDYEQRDATDPYATSRDIHLRELEISAIRQQMDEKGRVLDLGCGNGYTLLSLARTLPNWDMTGVDFSPNLISGAQELLKEATPELQSSPRFICADAISFVKSSNDASVDYVITERFLQNLPSQERQREVLEHIYRTLAPGGRLLMCEGEDDGFDRLNDVREALGLSRIPATGKDNVSALRFSEEDVAELASDIGFVRRDKLGFATYFLISRVLHPLLAAPLAPRFDAAINELAGQIQQQTLYEPGYGSNVLWVLEKPVASNGDRPAK